MSRLGRGGLYHRGAAIVRGLLQGRIPRAETSAPCLVVGHRGAARLEPENTIRSFQRALELGADTIETDISVTSDGRFALWHDADPNERVALARQLGAERLAYRPSTPPPGSPWRRLVRDLSSDELAKHHGYVASGNGSGNGSSPARVGIDWLEDLLEWIPRSGISDVFLDVKLAEDQTDAAAALVAELRGRPASGGLTYHLLSPREEIVRALAAACGKGAGLGGNLRVSADLELPAPELSVLTRTGARDVSLGLGGRLWPGYRYDVGRMLRARDAGVFGPVVAWTLNERRRLHALVTAGVDGILTDEPALLRTLVAAARRGMRRG